MKKLLTAIAVICVFSASAQTEPIKPDTARTEPVKADSVKPVVKKIPPDSLALISAKELDEIEKSIESSVTVADYRLITVGKFIAFLKQYMIEKYNTEKEKK